MTPRLIAARHVGGYVVELRYEDGTCAQVDLDRDLWGDVFEPLRDMARFKEFRLDPELQTLVWPNGADFAPEHLYERATTSR